MSFFTLFTPGHRAATSDVGACCEVEQALASKFALLSTVLENVGHGIVMFDASRRLLVWNNRYQQILQFPDGFLQVGLSNWEMALYLAKRGDYGEGDPEKLTAERLNLLWSRDEARSEITMRDENIYDMLFQRTDDGGLVFTYTDITEQKRTERLFIEQKQLLQAVVDAVPAIITVKDRDLQFLMVNQMQAEELGCTPEEAIGKRRDAFPRRGISSEEGRRYTDVQTDREHEVLRTGEARLFYEESFTYENGEVEHRLVNKIPLHDANGQNYAILTVAMDITERKQAEQALQESEERFRAVVDNSPTKIHIKDAKGRYVLVNRLAERMFGVTDEGARGKTTHEIFAKEQADGFVAHDRAVLQNGETIEQEEEWLQEDGVHTFLTVKFPIRDSSGKVVSVGAIGTDITERKGVEEALRESEAQLSKAAEMAKIGHWVWDEIEDKAIYCSEEEAKMHGVASGAELAAMLSSHAADLEWVHPDDRERFDQAVRTARETKRGYDIEHRIVNAAGEIRYLHEIEEPVLDARGKIIRSNGISQDITEDKRAEEALRESEARYRAIVEDQTELICRYLPDQTFTFVNDAYCLYFDKTREDLIGWKFAPLIPDKDLEIVLQRLAALNPECPVVTHEHRIVAPDGETRWHLWTDRAIFDTDGRIIEYQSVGHDITERKRAEEALRDSRDHIRLITDSLSAGICYLDSEQRVRFVNRTLEEWYDRPAEEILGRTLGDILGKEVQDRISPSVNATLEGKVQNYEHVVTYPDGKTRAVHVEYVPHIDESGKGQGLFALVHDITERKRADEALRMSEERYALAVSGTNDGLWDWNIQTDEDYFSPRWKEIVGCQPDELEPVMQTFVDLVHPDDRKRVHEAVRAHLETRAPYDLEIRLRHKSGEYVWVRSRGQAIWDEDGEPLRMAGSITDITERKCLEDEVRWREQELSEAQRVGQIGHWRLDLRKREFTEWSDEVYRIFGVDREIFVPTVENYLVMIHEDDLQMSIDNRNAALAEKKPYKFEYRIVRPNGEVRTIAGEARPECHESGEMATIFGVTQDITEDRSRESQLRQSQKLEAVGQLTGGVAHDFNNLLAVILGNLEFAKEELEADSSLHLLLDPALRATKRGGELTQRLLSFSRQQALHPQTVDLNACVTGMTDMLRRTLGETIEIESIIASGLWTCKVDPGQLESALLNLAVNARDAMSQGGRLTIETANIELDDDYAAAQGDVTPGHYVRLSVTDTGTGIPSEYIEHVFEPFFTTKEVGAGSGLGLSMVFGFAKQSGGHVTISSEPGCGTAVQLYLPQAKAPAQPAGQEPAMRDPEAQGETVLVVEDDPDVRSLVISLLQRLGYNILEACDGVEALAAFQVSSGIDLLLSDVVLPGGVSGPDLAKQVTDRYPGIKVLFMSGYPDARHRHGPMVENYQLLGKPFGKRDLAQKVRAVLNG